MKLKSNYCLAFAGAILLGLVSPAGAIGPLTGVPLGTAAPPSTLGPWTMTPFVTDPSAVDSMLTSLGPITFSEAIRHDQIGNGWGTWSHGFAGNVYDTASFVDPTSLTMTLAGHVQAFYFYAEPVNWANFTFTATTDTGTFLTQTINGNAGATGFGFYATGSDYITSITVRGTDADGFAVGEFGFASAPSVPETGSGLVYASLAFLGLLGCRFVFRGQTAAPVARV